MEHAEHLYEDTLFSFPVFLDILKHSIMITLFVIVMMLIIEYLTVQTRGKWSKPFTNSPALQIIFSAFMGIIPGCMGTYAIVSMYTHKIVSFAALVTVMIATFGDEAFILFSMSPGTAVKLIIILFVIAIGIGFLLILFTRNKNLMVLPENHLKYHESEPECHGIKLRGIIYQLKHLSFHRTLLIVGGVLFSVFLASGDVGPEDWGWEKITFLIVVISGLLLIISVPDHFLNNHLWGHVIKKHALKIFLWTLGAFLIIHFIEYFIDVDKWISNNYFLILLIALAVGIIPESGPNLIFITLFVNGTLPFGILLANSIVQDGHGSLPLLAESRISFFWMKILNILVGIVAGFIYWIFLK